MTLGNGASHSKCHFDDNYKWPNLFQEADEMLQASLAMYLFTKLRMLAKEGMLKNADKLLELPITASDAVELIEGNTDVLKEQIGDEDSAMCRSALKSLHERHKMLQKEAEQCKTTGSLMNVIMSAWQSVEVDLPKPEEFQPTTLVAFGDDHHEEELVYAVAVDRGRKRITVAFRGSVTPKDFVTDACIHMNTIANPLAKFPGQDPDIKIHSGFWDYLLCAEKSTRSRQQDEDDTPVTSKFEQIIEHVVPLFEENPGFKLYVTGHSLGGALATLFAFQAATTPLLNPTPVTCISVASPKVGDESWRKSFQLLEEQGKLRHLRICNDKDPVTLSPPASAHTILASMSPVALAVSSLMKSSRHTEVYKHVGIKCKFYIERGNTKFKISYANGSWNKDLFHPASVATISDHYGHQYSSRLAKLKKDLVQLKLNDLYKKKDSLELIGGEH